MTFLLDNRDPDPHPWAPFLPAGGRLVRGTLDTGDLCLAALPEGATVERKTVPDFLAAVGRERARFDRELRRARHLDSFVIIVEGSFGDVLNANHARGQLSPNAILGSVAAWTRQGAPVLFAGSVRCAAELAYAFLAGQVREIERASKALARVERGSSLGRTRSGSSPVTGASARPLAPSPR